VGTDITGAAGDENTPLGRAHRLIVVRRPNKVGTGFSLCGRAQRDRAFDYLAIIRRT
jgi:hypothetical protein